MPRPTLRSFAPLLAGVLGLLAQSAFAQGEADDLVLPVDQADFANAPLRHQSEKRVRAGRLQSGALADFAAPTAHRASRKKQLRLHLFDDATYDLEIERTARSAPNRSVVVGKIAHVAGDNALMNSAIVSTVNGATAASIIAPDGRVFQITADASGASRIAELDRAQLGGCGDATAPRAPLAPNVAPVAAANLPPAAPALPITPPPPVAAADVNGPVIDVMLLYTQDARAGAGGTDAMQALCELTIAQANQAFTNSGVNAQLRLVHTEEIAYAESGSASTDLQRLQSPNDGFLDQVQGLRDQYQADVVHLIVENMTSYSGLAYFGVSKTGIFPDYAYGVDKREFLTPFTFPHELAHNFGLDHDRENATHNADGSTNAAFSYGFGNRFVSPDDNVQYRTLMAYAPGQQVLYFSNPDLTYKHSPLGVPKDQPDSSDDARALNNAAAIVAGFRGNGQNSQSPHLLVADNKGNRENSIDFGGTQAVGSQSAPAYFYLYNSGNQTLRISNIKEGGQNPGDFPLLLQDNSINVVTGSSFNIGPKQYFYVAAYFRPTAAGERSATITFASNEPTNGNATVTLTMVGAVRPRLANISTRLQVGAGDGVLIGGFIVQGSANKKLIIRATGPSLAAGGVTDALSDPTLEVYNGTTLVASNDDWGSGTDRQAIIDTGLAPTNDLESALIANLAPGSYTAVVRGFGNATGTALVEIYDVDPDTTSQLVNISTRGAVKGDDSPMIGGVVVTGTKPARVIIRAIGPSLAAQGVGNVLANPTLELHKGAALIAQNDDWVSSPQQADIAASGIAPSDHTESAIIATLEPGNYTAVVHGANGATGNALIEVYKLQ